MKIFLIFLAVIFYFILGYVITNVIAAIYDMDFEDLFDTDEEGPLGFGTIFFWPIVFLILLIIFIGQKLSIVAVAITMFLINKNEKDESNTWIITDEGNIKCPNCGEEPYFVENKKYNFCPFCGVHLDYVKEEK